jgi:hypothetical protein
MTLGKKASGSAPPSDPNAIGSEANNETRLAAYVGARSCPISQPLVLRDFIGSTNPTTV